MGALFGKLTVRIMWDGGCGTADTVEGSLLDVCFSVILGRVVHGVFDVYHEVLYDTPYRTGSLWISSDAETPLVLHLGESTVELPFSTDEARNLGRSFNGLLQTFKEKQAAEKPQRWDLMRYSYENPEGNVDDIAALEVICNPNAFPTAFDAKLMISLESKSGIKISGEANLSQTKSDLQNFIAKHITAKQS